MTPVIDRSGNLMCLHVKGELPRVDGPASIDTEGRESYYLFHSDSLHVKISSSGDIVSWKLVEGIGWISSRALGLVDLK